MSTPKNVSMPGGPASDENKAIGVVRQIRIDTSSNEIRVHDGVTLGGTRIPSEAGVKSLIASGASGVAGVVKIVADETELAAIASPNANMYAVVVGVGITASFIWRTGPVPAIKDGAVASAIDGHWARLDSGVNAMIAAWRAGMVNLQIDGTEPATDQSITIWLVSGVIKMWNGAAYVAATPTLYCRYLASLGGYYSGTVSLPDRIDETLTEIADVNAVTDSGWYITKPTDANSPVNTAEPMQVYANATSGVKIIHVSETQGDRYISTFDGATWSAWALSAGQLPNRLKAVPSATADADTALDSGFYTTTAAATNIPLAQKGVLRVVRYSSTEAQQAWASSESDSAYTRRFAASAWTAWVPTMLNGVVPVVSGGTGVTTVNGVFKAIHTAGTNIASASTIDLDAADGSSVVITGSTTITAVTLADGKELSALFSGSPQITVGANLVANGGGANLQIESGDTAVFRGFAAGVVRVIVQRSSGEPLVSDAVRQESLRPRAVNGNMQVSVRNSNAEGTTTGYRFADNWSTILSLSAGAAGVRRVAALCPGGSEYRGQVKVNTALASVAATDLVVASHGVEGREIADALFGSAGAKQLVCRFFVNHPAAGTYPVAMKNPANTRSFVREYVISSGQIGQDVEIEVTFPGCTDGVWPAGEELGAYFVFPVVVGSNYRTTPNAWQSGNFAGTSSTPNGLATLNALTQFGEFDFKLDSAGTDAYGHYEVPSRVRNESMCSRYLPWVKGTTLVNSVIAAGQAHGTTNAIALAPFRVRPRVIPTGIAISAAGDFFVTNSAYSIVQATAVAFNGTTSYESGGIAVTVAAGLAAGNSTQFGIYPTGLLIWTGCELL